MFVIVPLLCFVFLFAIFYEKSWENGDSSRWRTCFLSASLAWGVLLTAITELLSVLSLLTFGWLLALWGLASLITFIYLALVKKPREISKKIIFPNSPFLIILLAGMAFVVVTVGLIALIAPPNNWDSMTYHMSRVVHWIQNRSVRFYPTHIPTQLYHNPWAEFAIMNLQALSGGDRFANLVQWYSMLGSIVGVTVIAEQLGADLRGQIFAAVIAATIPEGILEASSTQNDYVTSFWILCLSHYVIHLNTKQNLASSIGAASSLGLAILTKATAYVWAFPFLLWLFLSGLKTWRWKLPKVAIVIALIAVAINIGHYARNFELYGSPIGSVQDAPQYTNDGFTVSALVSNVMRNLALHIGTPSARVNLFSEREIRLLHGFLNTDPDDRRTTLPTRSPKFFVPALATHEDTAGNPLHILMVGLVIAVIVKWRGFPVGGRAAYLMAVTGGFLLFALILKWQPYHTRLLVPFFVLFAPLIAVVLCRISNERAANSMIAVLLLSSLLWVFCNESRPIAGKSWSWTARLNLSSSILKTSRINQYFSNRPDLIRHYVGASDFVKTRECRNVGLSIGVNDWEYPFWVLLNESSNVVRLEHVNVTNESWLKSRVHPFNDFIPCAIISVSPDQQKEIDMAGIVYLRDWSSGQVSVLTPRGACDTAAIAASDKLT